MKEKNENIATRLNSIQLDGIKWNEAHNGFPWKIERTTQNAGKIYMSLYPIQKHHHNEKLELKKTKHKREKIQNLIWRPKTKHRRKHGNVETNRMLVFDVENFCSCTVSVLLLFYIIFNAGCVQLRRSRKIDLNIF